MATGLLSLGEKQIPCANVSSDIDEHMAPTPGPKLDAFRHAAGAKSLGLPVISGQAKNGLFRTMFDGLLFDRIIVIPRTKALGYVLSDQQYSVEVWNAFMSRAKMLNTVTVDGPDGVYVTDPYGTPLHYPATRSRIYTVNVQAAGGLNINNTVNFNFVGGIAGANTAVTGTRLVVFALYPNWETGIKERLAYLTEVLTGYDDTEQRMQLQANPARVLNYAVLTTEARDSALMDALLWGWQSRVYAVPVWQDIRPLDQQLNAGSQVVKVTTTDREFTVGGLILVWRDPYTWEVFNITGMAGDQIQVSSPAGNTFQVAGTWVVPLLTGRLEQVVELAHLTSAYANVDLIFIIEVV